MSAAGQCGGRKEETFETWNQKRTKGTAVLVPMPPNTPWHPNNITKYTKMIPPCMLNVAKNSVVQNLSRY
jgi:hypothetical protein